jgi:hypothetical protein
MAYLAATAGIAGLLCSANLLLTLLLIRRVNAHAERLPRRRFGSANLVSLPAGEPAPVLTVPTISGGTYSLGGAEGDRSLIAFLAPGCAPCHQQLPELREYARTIPGGATRVLAVVLTHEQSTAVKFARELTGWASVTLESPHGTIHRAFSVSSYPTFYTVAENGKIEAGGMAVRHLVAARTDGRS